MHRLIWYQCSLQFPMTHEMEYLSFISHFSTKDFFNILLLLFTDLYNVRHKSLHSLGQGLFSIPPYELVFCLGPAAKHLHLSKSLFSLCNRKSTTHFCLKIVLFCSILGNRISFLGSILEDTSATFSSPIISDVYCSEIPVLVRFPQIDNVHNCSVFKMFLLGTDGVPEMSQYNTSDMLLFSLLDSIISFVLHVLGSVDVKRVHSKLFLEPQLYLLVWKQD